MKRLPFLNIACGIVAVGLALGCTATVGGVSNPPGGGGSVGTGTGATGVGPGNGGTGAGNGIGGGSVGTGTGGTGVGTGSGGTGLGTGSGGTGAVADPNAAGLRPLRLLTRREYANTARDLLGDTTVQPGSLPSEEEDFTSGFGFRTSGTVATQDATLLRDAAEALAKAAIVPAKLATLVPCAANATTATEATCLTSFFGLNGLAMKAYRRPLSTAEVSRLMALYTAGRAAPLSLTFAGAIGLLIEGILQSPEFLYHWGDPAEKPALEGTVAKLGSYEIANRLSYFLWGTMPDATLFTAAAAGQLSDAASVDAQVRRMLKDTKATALPTTATGTLPLFADFVTDWLDFDTLPDKPKDPALYAMYNEALTTAMMGEVQRFANTIFTTGTGRLDDLLTGTASFANQPLAALYGITGVTGTALAAVMLPAAQRSGLLTTAGFMSLTGSADGSNPPRRGKVILEKVLCRTLPPVPPVVPPVEDAAPGNGTTRQRFERHVAMPCATVCHSVLDPLGFPFENYDGIGKYRTTDNGMPVNAAVTVPVDGQAKMVADARGLVAALATSDEVQTCFTKQWFQYGLGRKDTPQDLASINAAATAFKNSMRDARELVVGLATSRTFRYRTPAPGEVIQ